MIKCDYVNARVFKNRLSTAMKKRGYNPKELADELDVFPSTIQNHVYGRSLPSLDLLVGIADTLNVSLDYLLGRSDKMEL